MYHQQLTYCSAGFEKESRGFTRNQSDMVAKLRSLITVRLIIAATLLLGAAIPLEISERLYESQSLFRLIILILFLSLLYLVILLKFSNTTFNAYIQLLGDIFLETLVIMASGGIESPFSILYVITIVVACNLLQKRGGIIITVIISSVFSILIASQYLGGTHFWPVSPGSYLLPTPSFALYIIIVNFSGFFLTAVLSSHLVDRVQRIDAMLTDKNEQYNNLLALNDRIVNEIPTGLITATLGGEIISINPAAKAMISYETSNESNRHHLNDILPSYLVHSILQVGESGLLGKRSLHFQKEIDSEKKWYHLEFVFWGQQIDSPARIMLILNDITDQKRLEDTRRKAERWSAVAEISAGMAHEIRNPLASISGSIEILKESLSLSNSETRLMNIVVRESDRLNGLITDFLDFAKPRPPEFAINNINALISDTVVLIQNSPNFPQTITVETHFQSPSLEVMLDPNQFLQLAWNLSRNAIDAMPHGGTLQIETKTMISSVRTADDEEIADAEYAIILFRDNGVGMSPDMIERIFDPFTTYKRKGVGIGLAIVYRIVENHRGRIRVSSALGEGTVFEMEIPLRQELNTRREPTEVK